MEDWTTDSWGDDWSNAKPVLKPVARPSRKQNQTSAASNKPDVSSEPNSANAKAATGPKAASSSLKKQNARTGRGRISSGGSVIASPYSDVQTGILTGHVPLHEDPQSEFMTSRRLQVEEPVGDVEQDEERPNAERELEVLAKQEQQRAEAEAEMRRIAREENAERLRQQEILVAEQKRKEEDERKLEQQGIAEERRKAEERQIEAKKLQEAQFAEETRKAEEAKKAEEVRKIEERGKMLEARRAEGVKKAEEAKKADELRKIVEARKAEEARKTKGASRAGEARVIGEVSIKEEETKAEEIRNTKEIRKAEEAKKLEEERKAGQRRLAEEAEATNANAKKIQHHQQQQYVERERRQEIWDEEIRQQEQTRIEAGRSAEMSEHQQQTLLETWNKELHTQETFETVSSIFTEPKSVYPFSTEQPHKDPNVLEKEHAAAEVMRHEQSRLMAEDEEQCRLEDSSDISSFDTRGNITVSGNSKSTDGREKEGLLEASQFRMYQEIENDLREEHKMFSEAESQEKLRQGQNEAEHPTEQPDDDENAALIPTEMEDGSLNTEPDVKQVSASAVDAEWGWGDDAEWNDNSTLDTVDSSDTTIQSPRSGGAAVHLTVAETIAMSVTSPDVFGRNEVADEPFSTESAIASDPRSSTFIETSNPNQLAPSTSTQRSRGSSRFSGISLSPLHSEQSFPGGQLGASSGSRGTDGRESISSADNQQSYDEDEDGHSSAQSFENGERHRLRDRYDSRTTDTDDDERRDGNRHNGTYSPSVTNSSFSSHQEDDVESVVSAETVDSAGTNWTVTNPIEQIMRAFGGMGPAGHPFGPPGMAPPFPSQYDAYPFPTPSIQPSRFFATAPAPAAIHTVDTAPTSLYLRKYLYPHAAGDFILEKAVAVNNLEKPVPAEIVRVQPSARFFNSDMAKFPHDLASGATNLDDRISVYCKAMSEAAFEYGSLDQSKREEGLMWSLLSLLVRHGTNIRNYAIAETLMASSRDRSLMGSSTSLMSAGFTSELYPGEKKLSGVRRCLAAGLIPRACKAAEEQGRTPLAFMLLSLPSVIKTNNSSALAGFMRYIERTISPADPIYTACALMCGHLAKLNECVKNWTMHAALTIGCGSLVSTTSKNRFLLNLADLFDGLGRPMVRDILYLLARPVARVRDPDMKLIGSNVFANQIEQSIESSAKIVERLLLTEIFVFVTNKINPTSTTYFVALPQLIYIEQLLSKGDHAEVTNYLLYVYRNATLSEVSSVSSVFWITFFTLVVTNQSLLEQHNEMYSSVTARVRNILDEQRVHRLARQAEAELRLMEETRQLEKERLLNEQLRLEEQARRVQNSTALSNGSHQERVETFSPPYDVSFSAHVEAHRNSPSLSRSRPNSNRASPHSVTVQDQGMHSTNMNVHSQDNSSLSLNHFPPPMSLSVAPVSEPAVAVNAEDQKTVFPSNPEDFHSLRRQSRVPSVQNETLFEAVGMEQLKTSVEPADTAYDEEGGWEANEHLDFFRLPEKSTDSDDERDHSSYGIQTIDSTHQRQEPSRDLSQSHTEFQNHPPDYWSTSVVSMIPPTLEAVSSAGVIEETSRADASDYKPSEDSQQENQAQPTYGTDVSNNYYHLDYSYNIPSHPQEYSQVKENLPENAANNASESGLDTNPADQATWNTQQGMVGTGVSYGMVDSYQQQQQPHQFYQDPQAHATQYQQWSDQQQSYYSQYPTYDASQIEQTPHTDSTQSAGNTDKQLSDAVGHQQQTWNTVPATLQTYSSDTLGDYAQHHLNNQYQYSAVQPRWSGYPTTQLEQFHHSQPEMTANSTAVNPSWNANDYYQIPSQSVEPEVPLEEDGPSSMSLPAYKHTQQTAPSHGFPHQQFSPQLAQSGPQQIQPQQSIPTVVPAESGVKPGLMGRFTGLFKGKTPDTVSQSASFNSGPSAPPLYNYSTMVPATRSAMVGAASNGQFMANPSLTASAHYGEVAQSWQAMNSLPQQPDYSVGSAPHMGGMHPNSQFPPNQVAPGTAYSLAQAPQLNAQVHPGQKIPALY